MIKSIQIQNFESHKDTRLALHPGVNVIIGNSDQGKSSIIRAIRWLAQNRPIGDAFKNDRMDPRDSTSVTASFQKTGEVVREKAKGSNSYHINDTRFKALRSDVPDEVHSVTKLKQINIQSQHPSDQYFMLTESPGQVAKKFNEVSGLSVMDKAQKEINTDVRENKAFIKIIDESLKEAGAKIKSLKWVEKALAEAKAIKDADDLIRVIERKQKEVKHILETLNALDFSQFTGLGQAMKDFDRLGLLEQSIKEQEDQLNQVAKIIGSGRRLNKQILHKYDKLKMAMSAAENLRKLTRQIDETEASTDDIRSELKSVKQLYRDIYVIEQNILELSKKFKAELEAGGCPICGGES